MFGKDDGFSLSHDFYKMDDRGLIPRAVDYLFNQLSLKSEEVDFSIYNILLVYKFRSKTLNGR